MARLLRHRWVRDFLFACMLALAAGSLLAFPTEAIEAAKKGLSICANAIVPSLLPFFVLSSLCVELGLIRYLGRLLEPLMQPLFRLRGACAAALALGMIGGYPVGAKTAIALYESGHIQKDEAEHLLAFCNNCGPAFLFGVVGAGVFQSGAIGAFLFCSHILASLLVGVLLRGRRPKQRVTGRMLSRVETVRFSAAFTKSVTDAVRSTLSICGFVIFFTVVIRILFCSGLMGRLIAAVARILQPFGMSDGLAKSLLLGAIEMTSGVWSLQSAAGSMASQLCMAAFILGWAGLCVHCQTLSFLGDAGLSARVYLFGKLLHGLLAAALTWGALRLFPQHVTAFYIRQVSTFANLDFSTALRSATLCAAVVWGIVCLISVCMMLGTSGHRRRNLL